MVSPPKSAASVMAIRTSAPPAMGWRISPAIVATKIPSRRQLSGLIESGRGIRKTTAQYMAIRTIND